MEKRPHSGMTDTELCIPCRMKKWAGILQEAAALQLWPAICFYHRIVTYFCNLLLGLS